jgi:uncharacterized protein
MFVRSTTVYLVRRGTLRQYAYLEHGAHWAIGALAVIMLFSLKYDIPELATGLTGLGIIAAALASSLARNRAPRRAAHREGGEQPEHTLAQATDRQP